MLSGTSKTIFELEEGDVVNENFITNYFSLTKLIKAANSFLEKRGEIERIDESIVKIRDAFAHGRVLSNQVEGPYCLYKFDKPSGGKAKVTTSFLITSDWLSTTRKFIVKEREKVIRLGIKFNLANFQTITYE